MYTTRLALNEIFSPSNKIHREVGRTKDLSAPRYSKLNTDILCEACQVKAKYELCSYHLTDDRFNERSEGVVGREIN